MLERNDALLEATLAYIEAHPQEWHQDWWRCETGMCFAGHAAVLAGGTWLTAAADDLSEDLMVPEPGDDEDHIITWGGLTAVTAGTRAQRVLGLDDHAAAALFAGGNTLNDIRLVIAALQAGER